MKRFHLIEILLDAEGRQSKRGVGYDEIGFEILDLCGCFLGEIISTCHECGGDQREKCEKCDGAGYIRIVPQEEWTADERTHIADLSAERILKKAVASKTYPVSLERFANDREILIPGLLQLGKMMYLDVMMIRWPLVIREQVFKHFVEGLFSVLGGAPPKEFYSDVLSGLMKELKPAEDMMIKEKVVKTKKTAKAKDDNGELTIDSWMKNET